MNAATLRVRQDDQRPHEVREDVRPDDPPVARPDHAGGLDELLLADRQRHAAHHAGRVEPPQQTEDEDERDDALPRKPSVTWFSLVPSVPASVITNSR